MWGDFLGCYFGGSSGIWSYVTRAHARAFPRNFKKASTLHNLYYKLSFSALYVWRLLSSLHVFATFCPFSCYFSHKAYSFPYHKILFFPPSILFFPPSILFFPCINFHFPTQEFSTPRPRRLYATLETYIRHGRGVYTSRPWRREYFLHNTFIVNTVMLIYTLLGKRKGCTSSAT